MTYAALQAIHLPYEVYLDLELHLLDTRPDIKPGAFIQELVQRWLALDKERHAVRARPSAARISVEECLSSRWHAPAYQLSAQCEFATVVSEQIVADDGQVLTPSQFANRQPALAMHGALCGYACQQRTIGYELINSAHASKRDSNSIR
jgi:hypothetical protein